VIFDVARVSFEEIDGVTGKLVELAQARFSKLKMSRKVRVRVRVRERDEYRA